MCTSIQFKFKVFAPTLSPILMPSPLLNSPLVVGRWSKSGRYLASKEPVEKSAPKPPVARMTGPCASVRTPQLLYLQPTTASSSRRSSRTSALRTILALSLFSKRSSICANLEVISKPGIRSAPLCVRGSVCPPRRHKVDKSRSNSSANQSTAAPLLSQRILASSRFLAPFPRKSARNSEAASAEFDATWVLVPDPLMPDAAFAELPPREAALSNNSTLPPQATTW
mmetsp:Transcript_6179/g.17253  ORF Transcript_6179/g.17253 Transcript_6179/m.17253 type:complete len:226 (+) Transcript_6179:694-1371(+)